MTHSQLVPEWHRQNAVLLIWPHRHSDWASQLHATENVYLDILRALLRFQTAVVICYDSAHQADIRHLLMQNDVSQEGIIFVNAPSNDTWIRDCGPLTAGSYLVDFRFNGWGRKHPYDKDDRISQILHRSGLFGDTPIREIDRVLEGGSVESDGRGTLMTTASCLLAETRNPGLGRSEMESMLSDTLGVQRILWLEHGALVGDDTDGHIDMLARFCNETTIAYTRCDEPAYPYYKSLRRMELELSEITAFNGEPCQLVPLPWPEAKYDAEGQRLPASYANFLIINGAVLMPTYSDPADGEALRILQSCFPDREVIGIYCLPLIQQFGSLHCITMQIPDTVTIAGDTEPGTAII